MNTEYELPSPIQIEAEKCRRSYHYFFQKSWEVLNRGRPLDEAWYVKAVCDHLQAVEEGKIKNLMINFPPRLGKSMMATNIYPCWIWLRNPWKQIVSASYKERLAVRDSLRSRKLMGSPWYQSIKNALWGEDSWTFSPDANEKGRYTNSWEGWRISTSVRGSITGDGGDTIIVDDALHAAEANSEAALANLEDFWRESISTRMNDPTTGHWIIIQQRLHEDDLCGIILREIEDTKESWDHLVFPMRYEPNHEFPTRSSLGFADPRTEPGELLAPNRFPENVLTVWEKKLGPFGVAGQLEQRPVPKGGGIISEKWWRPVSKREMLSEYTVRTILQSWDTSYGEDDMKNNKPCDSACTTWGIIHKNDEPDNNFLCLLDCWHGTPQFHELRSRAIAMKDNWAADIVIIEKAASGISLIQELTRSGVYPYAFLPRQFGDKVARIWASQPIFQQGKIMYAGWRLSCDNAISAMTAAPKGRRKDIVDTISQAVLYFRDNMDIQLAGDPVDEEEEEGLYNDDLEPLYG